MTRVCVYVDGFNVFHGAMRFRGPGYKWLDLKKLVQTVITEHADNITDVHYFTASPMDRGEAARHNVYIKALKATGVLPTWGHYVERRKNGRLIVPTRPRDFPSICTIMAREEKGSDVNLATRLVVDAYEGRFDEAVVLSHDADLKAPIRHVAKQMNKPVWMLVNRDRIENEGENPTQATLVSDLVSASTKQRGYYGDVVQACQLPPEIVTTDAVGNKETVRRPPNW